MIIYWFMFNCVMTSDMTYICPIDRSTMKYGNFGDGYESEFGAVCHSCGFLYSKRDSGGLEDQARAYVTGVIGEYHSLKSKKKDFLQKLEHERSGLEQKIRKLKGCAQGEFESPLARVIFFDTM